MVVCGVTDSAVADSRESSVVMVGAAIGLLEESSLENIMVTN